MAGFLYLKFFLGRRKLYYRSPLTSAYFLAKVLERHCILAVLPERSQKSLEEGQRKAIRVVAMDMWGPYRGILQTKLPHAEIVADRFHGMKQFNDAIAKIRRTLQAKADNGSYELLKGTRWILVRNHADLKPDEEVKLQAVLNAFPALRRAYLLIEKFATIANRIHNRPQAERFLRAWVYKAQATGLSQLAKFSQTLQNWWNAFLNYSTKVLPVRSWKD